jgi:hypothetical protein
MKRSKESTRAMRRRNTAPTLGNSRYATKVRRGNMMYGDGSRCCAHRTINRGAK